MFIKAKFLVFWGANGAEKPQPLKSFADFPRPTSGEADIAGFDVYKEREGIKRNIGYMSQRFSLYEDLTVYENIRFYAGIYGISRKRIKERSDELLEMLGFQHARNKLIKEIPLGWMQKLAFSIAFFIIQK
jgi:ABC-2 type transport system ATP-binding protein